MSVLPEKYLELIHAEIDGEASEKELATLREYLASDTDGQKVRAELAKLTDVLGQVEQAETPSDLHTGILAALPTRRPIMETVGRNNSPWRLRTPFIRYGYALAAGLILGAALTGVAFRDFSPIEKSDVYGTMAAQENTSNYIAVDKMKLTAPDLGGSVELRRSGDNEMIVFDLNGEQAVEVEVKFDGSQTGLKGFSQQPNSIRSFEAKEGSISFLSEGNQRSTIMLATHKHAQLPLSLSFYVGGKLVHQGSLGSLAPGGSTK